MTKQYALLFMALICLYATGAVAQLPPVNFPSNQSMCDNTPWKLVFFDGFDGTALNTNKWFPFNTNSWDEHDNWCEARIGYPGNESNHRDENVVVSGGTLKLKIKQETNTWQCASCITNNCTPGMGDVPSVKNYTSGYISSKLRYNSGKIETRLRMPIYEKTWATVWTWYGSSVNEIDVAEAYGGRYSTIWEKRRPKNTFSTHAWWFDEDNNPYNLPQNMRITGHYPNQDWWNWFMGYNTVFRQDNWHTYTCEWDTTVIKF